MILPTQKSKYKNQEKSHGTLLGTKTTNLPSGTNNVVIGAGIDSASSENMYLSAITCRVKYA